MSKFRPNAQMLSGLCETLAEAVAVGLPVRDVFAELHSSESARSTAKLFAELCEYADTGATLSECLRMSGAFPDYMIRLLAVAEMTGHIDKTLSRLATHYALQQRLSVALKTSVTYPAILGAVLLVVLFIIATEVLPVFKGIYAQLGAALPPVAVFVFAFGEKLRSARWGVLIALIAIILVSTIVLFVLKRKKQAWSLINFLYGAKARRRRAAADLCSILSMTCSAGVEPSRGIALASELVEPKAAAIFSAAAEAMNSGSNLSAALMDSGLFERMDMHYIELSIKSGNFSDVTEKLAERYAEKTEEILSRRVALVEPVAVLVLAAGVGLMLLGVMLPLLGALSVLG